MDRIFDHAQTSRNDRRWFGASRAGVVWSRRRPSEAPGSGNASHRVAADT